MTVAHSAETSAKKVEPARRASVGAAPKPNAGLGQSWMCVKVTIEQKPNLETLADTLNHTAEAKDLTLVRHPTNENTYSATLSERSPQEGHKEGQIKVEASGQQVVITETKHSDSTLGNMASIMTALPPEGQSKDFVTSGPQNRQKEFKEKLEQSLASVEGPEKPTPPTLGGGASKE